MKLNIVSAYCKISMNPEVIPENSNDIPIQFMRTIMIEQLQRTLKNVFKTSKFEISY